MSSETLLSPVAADRGPEGDAKPGSGPPVPEDRSDPLLRPLSAGDWPLIAAFFLLLLGYIGGMWLCVHWILRWLFAT